MSRRLHPSAFPAVRAFFTFRAARTAVGTMPVSRAMSRVRKRGSNVSWTEPASSCSCGGSGADGCRPIESALEANIDRLTEAIGRDLAKRPAFRSLVRRDLASSDRGVFESPSSPTGEATQDGGRADQPAGLPSARMTDAQSEHLMQLMKEEGHA